MAYMLLIFLRVEWSCYIWGSFDISRAPTLELGQNDFHEWLDNYMGAISKSAITQPATLSDLLHPLFTSGVIPLDETCPVELQEKVVSWLSFVHEKPDLYSECTKDMPKESEVLKKVDKLSDLYGILLEHVGSIGSCRKHSTTKLEAVAKAAMNSYNNILASIKGSLKPDCEKQLVSRKQTVEAWVENQRNMLARDLTSKIDAYKEYKKDFESELVRVIVDLHKVYRSGNDLVEIDMSQLEAELEVELAKVAHGCLQEKLKTMEKEDPKSKDVGVDSPAPPTSCAAPSPTSESVITESTNGSTKSTGSVTETLQAMQDLLSKSEGLDPEVYKQISENLGSCFKDALTAPSKDDSVEDGNQQVGVPKT